MRREKPPPVRHPVLDGNGSLTQPWVRWFQTVGLFFDDYRRPADVVYTTDQTLTTDDFGKLITFNIGAENVDGYLPTVSARDINCWLTIFRTGTGRLTIHPDSATRIEYGTLGGRIWCHEERRAAANVTLQLLSEDQWAIVAATGIWNVA